MPEFRQNLATREWVILSPGRAGRPNDFIKAKEKRPQVPEHDSECPFCPGNEERSEKPVYTYSNGDTWQVRVVPNKFAALKPDLATTRSQVGRFLGAKGFGIAEVVIEHPRHDLSIATMEKEDVAQVLSAYRNRYIDIRGNDKINLVTIFRNHGARAGTSLAHPHSQIIATPIVPPHVRYPMEQAVMYYDRFGRCVYCDMLEEEIEQKERIIMETENFVTFCPYASRSPFETRIYPKKHKASYMLIDNNEIDELADVLRTVLGKLRVCLDDPDYNYIIRSSPVGDENTRHLHWYMVLIPKISTPAGFEIGSGIYINSMPPEDAARYLRETDWP